MNLIDREIEWLKHEIKIQDEANKRFLNECNYTIAAYHLGKKTMAEIILKKLELES